MYLFQAGFVHRYGNRTVSGYSEKAMITVGFIVQLPNMDLACDLEMCAA